MAKELSGPERWAERRGVLAPKKPKKKANTSKGSTRSAKAPKQSQKQDG